MLAQVKKLPSLAQPVVLPPASAAMVPRVKASPAFPRWLVSMLDIWSASSISWLPVPASPP